MPKAKKRVVKKSSTRAANTQPGFPAVGSSWARKGKGRMVVRVERIGTHQGGRGTVRAEVTVRPYQTDRVWRAFLHVPEIMTLATFWRKYMPCGEESVTEGEVAG